MIKSLSNSSKCLSWDEAWIYCACLFEHGYSDWRMPTGLDIYSMPFDRRVTWVDHDDLPTLNNNHRYQVTPVRDSDD